MSSNPTSFRLPSPITEDLGIHPKVAEAVNNNTNSNYDNRQAIIALKGQLEAFKTTVTTTASASTASTEAGVDSFNNETGEVVYFPDLGTVNDERGNTIYMTQTSDNGAKIILGDSSPITVTLNSSVTRPWFTFIDNDSSASASLVPASGVVYGSQAIPGFGFGIVFFDGANFFCGATGVQPQNTPAIANEFLTAFNAITGAFSQAQPSFSGVAGSLAAGQLPANVPVVSFGSGAPSGSSTEGYIYFNTAPSPYAGYVYHSGAWQAFS